MCKPDKWVLLNWDRHSTHESVALFELLRANYIRVSFFPAHGTDRLQLQDLEEFRVLKTDSSKAIDSWMAFCTQRNLTLEIADFPFVLQRSIDKSQTVKVTKTGLKKTSLFPFDPDSKLKKMNASKSYAQYTKQFAAEAATAAQRAKFRNPKAEEKHEIFGDVQPFASVPEVSLPTDSASGSASDAEPDSWSQNQSAPGRMQSATNPSPRPIRTRGSDPSVVSWNARPGLNDFAAQVRTRQVEGLVFKDALKPKAVNKPGARGKRLGKKNDLFTDEQVTAARDSKAAEKNKKTKAKKSDKDKIRALRKQITDLKGENKSLKKKPAAAKRKPVAKPAAKAKRSRGKQEKYETTSESEYESETEEEEEESEDESEDQPNSPPAAVPRHSNKRKPAPGHDDEEDGFYSLFSNNEEDDGPAAPKLGQAVAPDDWYIVDQVPSKNACTFKELQGKKILYRWEPPDKDAPRGWFRGLVRAKEPKGQWNATLGFTTAGLGSAKAKPFDSHVLLQPSGYGVDGKWVFVVKRKPESAPPSNNKRRRT